MFLYPPTPIIAMPIAGQIFFKYSSQTTDQNKVFLTHHIKFTFTTLASNLFLKYPFKVLFITCKPLHGLASGIYHCISRLFCDILINSIVDSIALVVVGFWDFTKYYKAVMRYLQCA